MNAQLAEVDIYTHIRTQIWTSIPAMIIALIVFAILEFRANIITTVIATGLGLNIIAGDQYIALVLPLRLFRLEFQKRGLKPQNLSRVVADVGTVTSALVPWNSCGAYMAATLGIGTFLYLPFAIFNIASPLLSLVYGITGFKIERLKPSEKSLTVVDN